MKLTIRDAARQRKPIDGADAQALEGALQQVEKELARSKYLLQLYAVTLTSYVTSGAGRHYVCDMCGAVQQGVSRPGDEAMLSHESTCILYGYEG